MSHADREPRISLQEQIAAVTCAVPWIAQHRQALDAAARTLRELLQMRYFVQQQEPLPPDIARILHDKLNELYD